MCFKMICKHTHITGAFIWWWSGDTIALTQKQEENDRNFVVYPSIMFVFLCVKPSVSHEAI